MRISDLSEGIEHEAAENRRKLDGAQQAIDAALATFECDTPGGGLGPGTHCAACCYGTGFLVTCEEEDELVKALSAARSALARYSTGVHA